MRIYIDYDKFNPFLGNARLNDLSIHLENHKWTFVSSIEDADVIPIVLPPLFDTGLSGENVILTLNDQIEALVPYFNNKFILVLCHTHVAEVMGASTIQMYCKNYPTTNIAVSTCNKLQVLNHISHNYYFNFVKAYFTQYKKFDLKTQRLWTDWHSEKAFKLTPIIKHTNPLKKFLIPNSIKPIGLSDSTEFKNYARIRLSSRIPKNDSYYSDFQKGIYLDPEERTIKSEYDINGASFDPIANKYFDTSIISVFVETIGGSNIRDPVHAITEKTYIPLIKGHFILPFSYCGIIRDLKEQGFVFPDWIDYSYDLIENDDLRLDAFLNSFENLKRMTYSDITEFSNSSHVMRVHNRNIFYRNPYDSLYDKVNQYRTMI